MTGSIVRLVPGLFVGLLLLAPVPAAPAASIEYLYVDASEGGGSGGHAALALGDRVFNFEYRSPGLLRLARESWPALRHRYGVLDNRTIVMTRVPVSDETYELVLDEFTRRYLVQTQHFEAQEASADTRRLLETALARRVGSGGEPIVLEGAGFFFDEVDVELALPPPVAPARDASPVLVGLRERVEAVHGAGVLERQMTRVREELDGLVPDPPLVAGVALSEDQPPTGTYGLGQRYRDAVLTLLALRTLHEARVLRPQSLAADTAGLELTLEERDLVEQLRARLESSLVRLVESRRPDRGFPLLLGMARLIALDQTLQCGRWVFLDTFPPHPAVLSRERLRDDPTLARDIGAAAAAGFETARGRLGRGPLPARRPSGRVPGDGETAEGFPEVEFGALEAAANRLVETRAALREGRDVRLPAAEPLPARGALHRDPILPALDTDALRVALADARAREAAYAAALERLYAYNLVTRNCVTEIFRTIEAALARDLRGREGSLDGEALEARVRSASAERLGGYVEWRGGSLTFIPAVSAISVREHYAVSEVVEIPSYRRSMLARMYRRESPLVVFLRESNTLTSTLYRKAPEDSAFLFFTDDAVAARPLFGAMNVIAGVGVAAAGLVMLPVDHGAALRSGIKGVVWSLPELAFFNIRKGTFPERARRPSPLDARPGP